MKKNFYFLVVALLCTSVSVVRAVPTQKAQSAATLIDVWDFGAEQLNSSVYNNLLNVSVINGWYSSSITAGSVSSSNLFPSSWTAGILSWTGGSNDRLRTANTSLTRYDTQAITTIGDSTLSGYVYVNGAAQSGRYFTLTLNEDDEVTLYAKSQNGTGILNFLYTGTTGIAQQDLSSAVSSSGAVVKFVAKNSGKYKIWDSVDKPFYYRILRKQAAYKSFSGKVDITEGADIPAGYGIVFTNTAGKSWTATAGSDNSYNINIPTGYKYNVSLANANGYIITSTKSITVSDTTSVFNLAIKKVELYTVTGSISGLGTNLSKMGLSFTSTVSSTYVPEPTINTSTSSYSVQLEANHNYIVSATGVNDYQITDNTINMAQTAATKDIVFSSKPTYTVTLDASTLSASQQAALTTTFTNLNESGYIYTFAPGSTVKLRDGNYSVSCSGLDAYPLQLALTSNLKVNGAECTKTLTFNKVTNWSFNDATISSTTTSYKGMLLTGSVNEITKGHLVLSGTQTAKIPVSAGQKLIITYYYTANFSIDGNSAITTTSGSTSLLESTQYSYTGTSDGYVTISNISGSTYITDITAVNTIPYVSTITVGTDKNYSTINAALTAARAMIRPNKERVKIVVDPGNYEEMLVVDVDSISLINAASSPSIALSNQGVDIDANAVRVTSYYGHGYNYYSMGTDQKWSADALRVNKENGYIGYVNTGSGTTNGSYWNATVVVTGAGFEAYNIIFENSYNQYISKKESEDVVVEWTSGGKGTRPTTQGAVSVQNKSFVERAAAIAYAKSADKSILYKCRIVGRQDSFYGSEGARIVSYKGTLMGGTDYLFGGMTLVAYMSNLAMNTSEVSTDVAYITAAQQTTASRGYLMYACNVSSAKPGTETASAYLSKPGEFGRPWAASTSEVVFYNTTIETSNNPSYSGKSLISPEGWLNTLSGTSNKCYEYGTSELSGENNSASRASWSTVLSSPVLSDATAINTFNFTKGTDNWDPIPGLINLENGNVQTSLKNNELNNIQVRVVNNQVYVTGISGSTTITVYNANGVQVKTINTTSDASIAVKGGVCLVKINSDNGQKVYKAIVK